MTASAVEVLCCPLCRSALKRNGRARADLIASAHYEHRACREIRQRERLHAAGYRQTLDLAAVNGRLGAHQYPTIRVHFALGYRDDRRYPAVLDDLSDEVVVVDGPRESSVRRVGSATWARPSVPALRAAMRRLKVQPTEVISVLTRVRLAELTRAYELAGDEPAAAILAMLLGSDATVP